MEKQTNERVFFNSFFLFLSLHKLETFTSEKIFFFCKVKGKIMAFIILNFHD